MTKGRYREVVTFASDSLEKQQKKGIHFVLIIYDPSLVQKV